MSVGGDSFAVKMVGAGPGEVIVIDNEDGTYTVRCCATKAGEYNVFVSLAGSQITPVISSAQLRLTSICEICLNP